MTSLNFIPFLVKIRLRLKSLKVLWDVALNKLANIKLEVKNFLLNLKFHLLKRTYHRNSQVYVTYMSFYWAYITPQQPGKCLLVQKAMQVTLQTWFSAERRSMNVTSFLKPFETHTFISTSALNWWCTFNKQLVLQHCRNYYLDLFTKALMQRIKPHEINSNHGVV